MNPVTAIDGKKTTLGNVLTLVGMLGVVLGLSGEEIEELKGIVQDGESLYVLITGVIVSAIGLMHKVVKVAGPLITWFHDWSIRKAMR